MITTCDTQDFVPFGRDYVSQHPGKFQLQVKNIVHTDHGLPLLKSFRDISIQDHKRKDHWIFYTKTEEGRGHYDEELYVSGNTVVWSRGGQDSTRSVMKTFTVDSPVLQALWCSFSVTDSGYKSEQVSGQDTTGKTVPGVCVVESSSISCFMENGEEYLTALPFQVSHAWEIKDGLLFERTVSPSEVTTPRKNAANQTTVFSLLHPLDEVAPVITRTGSGGCPKVSYLTDNTQHIVFSSLQPSLVLTYDTMVGVHSAWKVRQSRIEECNSVCNQFDQTNSLYQMGPSTPAPNMNHSNSASFSRRFSTDLSAQSPGMSPMMRSFSGRISSPAFLSGSQSPLVTSQQGIDRRSQSPSVVGRSHHRLYSPSPQTSKSPGNFFRSPAFNGSMVNDSLTEMMEPITPDICFQHVWTEPAPAIRDGSLGKASKAFLTRDLCGQQYMCYVISYRQQLRCVKFEESNDLSKLVFGAVAVIPARDAIPIQSLDLLVVLDTNGNLFVYSGTTKINRLHVPTLPLGNGSINMMRQMTPINSPVRGGVFTSSRPPSAMDTMFDEEFQLNQISPVPTELEESATNEEFPLGSGFIESLRDNVNSRFTLELTNGHMMRTSLPDVTSSPGLKLGLEALKHQLPRDTALQLLGRWYTVRNAAGSIGSQSEWATFIHCLLSMMGYETSRLALTSKYELDTSMSPVSAKRSRPSDQGSDEDWETLLSTDHHKLFSDSVERVLGLKSCKSIPDVSTHSKPCSISNTAILFPHIPAAFIALHMVYEELKLNTLLLEEMDHLVPLLFHLARDLQCEQYADYYCRDFPKLFNTADDMSQVSEEDLQKMQYPSVFSRGVPSVQDWIIQTLEGRETGPVLYIPNVCNTTYNVISLYALLLNKHMITEQAIDKCLRRLAPSGHRAPTCDLSVSRSFCRSSPTHNSLERVVLHMIQLGMKQRDLISLPVGVSLPIREAIFHCRCNPPSDWPEEAYELIGREDISRLMSLKEKSGHVEPPPGLFSYHPGQQSGGNKEEEDGMESLDEEYLKKRFSEDLRVQEARRLLQSSKPARIALVQKPENSDHDFIEEQERHLYAICIRTMALPVGRGMFSLRTHHPLPTETLPIPKLCLTGKAPPRNTTVDLSHIDTPPNMSAWPHFHNGVAAGLRIVDYLQVDATWILYNKPKSNELTNEYAGFLMSLGLNSHLVNLNWLNVHDYLTKGNEMTTIGLLLGLSAAKRSTMDLATMKVLSIHLPALLPPTSEELNVSHNAQVAAIMGVGLVYQGTGHSHTAEVLLAEIGRPPGPEMENCLDRESYSLAAGLALGLVMFGKGEEMVGTSDLNMADTLYHFMVGGHKRPLIGPNKERYKTPSYQIKEGDSVNVDVTSPGATLALGMLYFNTGNSAVSEWLKVPDTQFMLDHVRPDFLLLRTLSRGLVVWDSVLPSFSYILSSIPPLLSQFAFRVNNEETPTDQDIDIETMSQAFCNVIAGASMVIGLKFAGTANQAAFNTLMECMKQSLKIISLPSLVEQAGKSTVENCMITILLAMAMVMSGTGNLEVLRIARMLRSRVGPPYNMYVMYGSHMAIGMAIGLLFLGGGKYSLSTKDEAIAVMLCAFFPKFPTHSNDNRYHLQAFRHLYVLATEIRTVMPRDVDTGHSCYVPLEIRFKDTPHYSNQSFKTLAPCILPDLDLLKEVRILGPRYWPIVFDVNQNWNSLKLLLKNNGMLYVKQRAGHLSYVEDPKGYRSMLAKSLTVDHSSQPSVKPDVIKAFTSDPKILAINEFFLTDVDNTKQEDVLHVLSSILYECVTQEKPEAMAPHIILDQVVRRSDIQLASLGICQLKLVHAYYNLKQPISKQEVGSMHKDDEETRRDQQLMSAQFLLAMKNRLEKVLDDWQQSHMTSLVQYLKGESVKSCDAHRLSAYLVWFDIPGPAQLSQLNIDGVSSLPALHSALPHLQAPSLMRLHEVWQASR